MVQTPKVQLSVVVPFCDVEDQLAECLESIANQSLRDLEVLMVDCGSTDNGAVVAKTWTDRDPRFRLVQRGEPVRLATGEYLAFVEGGDVTAPGAYELMVGSLEQTGSDVACGGMAGNVTRTHVSTRPWLLRDRGIWNKVFRRAFWDAHELSHEDPSAATRAHVLAESVDQLKQAVYLHRRPGAGEIGLASACAIRKFLTLAAPELIPAYDRRVLIDLDLAALLEVLLRSAEADRPALMESGAVVNLIAPEVIAKLPAFNRLTLHLLGAGMTAELGEVLRFRHLGGLREAPLVREGRRWYVSYPCFRNGVPDEIFDVTDEIKVEAGVDRVRWVGDRLRIEGHALLSGLPVSAPEDLRIRVWLVTRHQVGRVSVPRWMRLPIQREARPEVTAQSGQSAVSYDWSGFTADLDPSALKLLGRWQEADWKLRVDVSAPGIHRHRTLGNPRDHGEQWPAGREVAPGVRVQPTTADERFLIRVVHVTASITGHRVADGALELSGWSAVPPGPVLVAARKGQQVDAAIVPGPDGVFVARLPLAELAVSATSSTDEWSLTLAGGLAPVLACDEARYPVPGGEFALTVSRNGVVRGLSRVARLVVTGADWATASDLALSGTFCGSDRPGELVLRCRSGIEHRVAVRWEGERFTAVLAPGRMPSFGGERPLESGRWNLHAGGVPLAVARSAIRDLPGPRVNSTHEVALRVYQRGWLRLSVRTALGPDERGPYAQRMLQTAAYPSYRRQGLRDTVLFDAYKGRQFSCNPRGIFEELRRRDLGLSCVWVCRDGQFNVPGATMVLRGSHEYHEALARARYVIGNTALERWFSKREGQTYVQCWHGTPLKRVGYDVFDMSYQRVRGISWMEHDVPQWDLLLSQNAFSTPLFQRAFGYDGEVLESGYPRNDLLSAGPELGASVRARLGIPPGRRVVLYAPTWRDDLHIIVGMRGFSLALDLARLQAALGDDHVVLLRSHYLVNDRAAVSAMGEFVIDVSTYPDITELYLAADVMVTDYSSAMFDFAVTGKPMLFYTYDLEWYRDHVRGFYFDFEAEAPGPLLRTTDEVVEALRSPLPRTAAYDAFAAKYCPHDDGSAAARVLDHLLQTR
ncbi:MAG: CDP-glycerol:poly(glycerophosphate)glycerophosph otransferase [Actinomycetia bacterium]|nr:CDP-glycerol:poly(glycerophosphate)glycerophosph otransferase [Actinomycetes bacterium]